MIFSFQCSTLTCDLHFSLFQQGIIITTSLPPPILSMSLSYIQLFSVTILIVIGFSCSVTFSHLHITQVPSMLHCCELSSRFYSVVTINAVFIPIIKYHQQTHLKFKFSHSFIPKVRQDSSPYYAISPPPYIIRRLHRALDIFI